MIRRRSDSPPMYDPEFYQALFRRLPLAAAVVDENLTVRDANEAYAAMAGGAVAGARLAVFFEPATTEGDPRDSARSAIKGCEAFACDGHSGDRHVRIEIAPLTVDGEPLAVVLLVDLGDGGESQLEEIRSAIRTIKHEINNPLTGALGNINLLLRRTDLDEKTRKRLSTAEQEIKKVAQIVQRLADLAPKPRSGSLNP
ncbi:MAG: PAS domain-containing protein [Blastocatellia bacterium]|nr:PAS domain-containing protein [Blastocatellia bacterium]